MAIRPTKVTINGGEYLVPLQTMGDLIELAEAGQLENFTSSKATGAERLRAQAEAIAIGLRHNHPEIDAAWVKANVLPNDIAAIMEALWGTGAVAEDKSPDVGSP